jgi:Pin2-interacting protein X1
MSRRNKIGADPNNTKWAKSTDRFGHKMLTAQGWKPGDTLGAENAAHASHYTTASASHIRVLLRDENLGLGAKHGRQDADKFGLDMFQGLLGRLNGKSDEVLEKEAGYRRDLRLKELVVKRMGRTTFVSGGFLMGDKIERTISTISSQTDVVAVKSKEKKSKKRKRAEDGEVDIVSEDTKESKASDVLEEARTKAEGRKSKKEKRPKVLDTLDSRSKEDEEDASAPGTEADVDNIGAEMTQRELKRQRKTERRAAKEARRIEKEERKRKKRVDELKDEATTVSSTSADTSETEKASDASSTTLQKTAAIARGRFAVRSRYSQQKRLAVADQQALKEIFMIKAGA